MARFLMLLAGCVVGAGAGCAALYFNPLTGPSDAKLDDLDRTLRYELPASAIALTHSGAIPLPPRPDGIEELWESTVRTNVLAMLALTSPDHEAPVAVASRALVPSRRTELLSSGVLADDLWLLTIPGEGSMYVVAETNFWPVAKDTLVSVSLLGRPFEGPRDYVGTAGPAPDGRAFVHGATGDLAGRRGRAVDRFRVDDFGRDRVPSGISGELRLVVDGEEEQLP